MVEWFEGTRRGDLDEYLTDAHQRIVHMGVLRQAYGR